jgi:hypothetical protein
VSSERIQSLERIIFVAGTRILAWFLLRQVRAGQECVDFESGVWGFAGADSEAVRGLHLGNCQGKKEGED